MKLARSAPQTTFTISYGGVPLNNDPAALTPVFIAPTSDANGIKFYSSGSGWTTTERSLYTLIGGGEIVDAEHMLGLPEDMQTSGATIASSNPLAMAYYAATQTGTNNFYLMAIPSSAAASVKSATEKAAKSEDVYGIYPVVQDATIVNSARAVVNNYSTPEKAQYKKLWVYAQPSLTSGATISSIKENVISGATVFRTSPNAELVNYVYAETNTVGQVEGLKNAQYIVPVLMTMRGYMPPHAPLTDVAIPGVSISDSLGLVDSDYEALNDAGVWICFKDGRGENVTRHAVTTCVDGTIAMEDSAVSNAHNIVRTVRDQVAWLRGNCNVTPALIDKIYANVQNAFNRILARNYSDLIGPQILEVNSVVVQQDPNNTAGVIGTFDLDLPDVYLKGDFTFNLF